MTREIRTRIEEYLADDTGNLTIWDVVGVSLGGYDSHLDWHLIGVLDAMTKQKFWADDYAKQHGLTSDVVELLSYIICSARIGEYGTSPRGAWLDGRLEDVMPAVLAKAKKEYEEHWR